MVAVALGYTPVWNFQNNGVPLVGGQLFSYLAGTSTPAATYPDSTGSTPLPNPILLNSRGDTATSTGVSCGVWWTPGTAYKFVLQDALGNQLWSQDSIVQPQSSLAVNQISYYGVDSGAVNAYVVTLSGTQTFTLVTGELVRFTALTGNTGASTLNVAGTGAIAVLGQTGVALTGGEILSTGPTWVQWTGSAWQIVGTGAIPSNVRTAAEIAASVTPVNYGYAPGNILRYGTNTTPLTTDITTAIQAAINQAARGGPRPYVPAGSYAITTDLTGPTGTFPLQGGAGPFAVDIYGDGREQTLIQAISGGTFTNAMLYFNPTPYQLTGSVTGIRFEGNHIAPAGLVFVGCDMPNVSRCWIRGCTGQGLWFNNCIMPTDDRNYVTGCGSASLCEVEFVSCTIGRRFQSYVSGSNAGCIGGLAIDKCTTFTLDGGNCESCGTPILVDSKSNTVGSVGVRLYGMDLENPGNGNRYIDIGAGLTGGAHTNSVDIGDWTGTPSGTTTQVSAVRLQNVNGARLRQANFALAGAPTVSYELAGSANIGVIIESHPNLTGVIPWVFVNGSQVMPASPLYDWAQNSVPAGYGDLTTSLNGATPSVLINATIGGYYGKFNMNNGGATTVTNLSGGTNGMRISIRFTNANTTLTFGTGSGQFNLKSGANVTPTAGQIFEFVAIGGNWAQP